MSALDPAGVARLYAAAGAARWRLDRNAWLAALQASVERGLATKDPSDREIERYLGALHLEDLALACACSGGDELAWEHFVRQFRPVLYRAAQAIDRANGRDLADSLYADLYGVSAGGAVRRSLFRYFHGRSSLATWLRAVLAQRHVDAVRARRPLVPLPDEGTAHELTVPSRPEDPERPRYLALLRGALAAAVGRLAPRDRLRLSCYYAQRLTLAQTGRVLGEHEASASRHLARTRKEIRADVEKALREQGLDDAGVQACFDVVTTDPGPIDLERLLTVNAGGAAEGPAGKLSDQDRSE